MVRIHNITEVYKNAQVPDFPTVPARGIEYYEGLGGVKDQW